MASDTRTRTRRDRLADTFWERHSNPWSGWTRLATGPVLLYALYRRDWRLLAAAIGYTAVNPVLFPRPDSPDAWMSRGVLAEREWLRAGNGTVSFSYPNVLNLLNLPVSGYALWAAIRKRPLGTVLGTFGLMGLKLWWIAEIVRRTEAEAE
ncbi:DUF6653 family protein [Halomarina litorea]|uniref:DUF6653 family protein n=1 Tax=Halomarina litorea TaxID=2961595 RepID=UPI0020C39332|nr:DUF6653 family protein [Halomarina sp. BCD28]